MPTLDISRITQKISARYPAVLANPKHKSDLIGLIKKGNEDQVVIYAKDVLDRKPNLKAHNKIAVDQRIQRRDWMKFQVEIEKELGDIYNLLADKVIKRYNIDMQAETLVGWSVTRDFPVIDLEA